MLDEQSTIQYEIRSTCDKPQEEKIQNLRMCKNPVRATGHAWALQKSSPIVHAINRHISQILAGNIAIIRFSFNLTFLFLAGLMKKWTGETIHALEKDQIHFAREKNTGGIKSLSLKRFLPIIVIYFGGVLLSIIVFIIEIYFSR